MSLKNFVMIGVGNALITDLATGREVLRLVKMESTGWSIAYTEQKVSGGTGLDAFEAFETGRTQSMKFQNNEFDMGMLEVATGKKSVAALSEPIEDLGEGLMIPSTGPYTGTLKHATCQAGSVRLRYNESREELAPKPTLVDGDLSQNILRTDFTSGQVVDVRITAVVGARESVASALATVTIGAVPAGVDVAIPARIMVVDPSFPQYDVWIDGFNVYWQVDGSGWFKSNLTGLVDKGTTYAIVPASLPTPSEATVHAGSGANLTYGAKTVVPDWLAATPPTLDYVTNVYKLQNCLPLLGAYAYIQDALAGGTSADGGVYVFSGTSGAYIDQLAGTAVNVTVDSTSNYDLLFVKNTDATDPNYGKRGAVLLEHGDVDAFPGLHPELTVIHTLPGIFLKPVSPPDDFIYTVGAMLSVSITTYSITPIALSFGGNDYVDCFTPEFSALGDCGNVVLGDTNVGVISPSFGDATAALDAVSQASNLNVALVTDGATAFATMVYPASVTDPATLLPGGWSVDLVLPGLWSKPVSANAPFVYNVARLSVYAGSLTLTDVPTTAGQYTVSGADITFAAADAGVGVLADYIWLSSATEYQVEVTDVLVECLRQYVSIVLRQQVKGKSGNLMGWTAIIHKAKYTGDFNLDTTRADAAKHSLAFDVLDPERADGKIVTFKKIDEGTRFPC